VNLVELIKAFLSDIRIFSQVVVRRPLRAYQLAPARAICESVIHRRGLTFAVVMSRQAGKNELSAQLEAYLMNLYQQVRGSSLVKASPTYKPQTVNSKMRLRDCLDNVWNAEFVHGDEGYIVRLGRCRAIFFSAHPAANVVGATATVLLECDEAQDVDEDKWNKEFAPMGASTNVTTVFYGTIWTSRTLLARVMRRLEEAQRKDGLQRVFVVPWQEVAREVPAYGVYVAKEMLRLGANHPIIRTQYELQEIDDAGRMLTPERVALMRGAFARERKPARGGVYVLTIDVAGEDEEEEGAELRDANPRKDSTVVSVLRVDLSGLEDPGLGAARYELVDRHWWTGRKHADLYGAILGLVEQWRAVYVVVDATGVGAGLTSFLQRRLGSVKASGGPSRGDATPGAVLAFEFSQVSKSDLGWAFLGLVESGRFKVFADDGSDDVRQWWREVEACEYEVLPGPGKVLRWGVRDPGVHDDCLVSAALVAALEGLEWRVEVAGEVIVEPDHLDRVDRGKF